MRGCSDRTATNYISCINRFKNYYQENDLTKLKENDILDYIKTNAEEKMNQKLITGIIPINVCAHCGPGTIGLAVSKKINGKSISDFI